MEKIKFTTKPGGVEVRVSSRSDWIVFNEIFVEGLYDRAITYVLSSVSTDYMLHILDLGANVGLFAMRFAQMVFQSLDPNRPFIIHCVEGSPQVYAELSARLAENSQLKGHVEARNGLAGLRSGSAQIYESSFGAGNSTRARHWSKPVTVPYIDLDDLVPRNQQIALVKCDIEGSEQAFQDNYQGLLQRSQAAVIELHHYYIDPERFHVGMKSLGFNRRYRLWESEKEQASLIFYTRSDK